MRKATASRSSVARVRSRVAISGEQPAILDRDLFGAVQTKLDEQANNHKATRTNSEGLLTGRIFDDRGNRMSPSHARKSGVKYRYYISSALLQGAADHAGSVPRLPATEIEALVISAVREHLKLSEEIDDRSLINTHVVRVEVRPEELIIQLAEEPGADGHKGGDGPVRASWHKTTSTRRREILLPAASALRLKKSGSSVHALHRTEAPSAAA
jgi:site-specific DNA recombinase